MNTPEDNARIAAGDPDPRRKPADIVAHIAEYDYDDGQPSFATDEAAAAYLRTVLDGDVTEAIGQLGDSNAGKLYNAVRIDCRARELMSRLRGHHRRVALGLVAEIGPRTGLWLLNVGLIGECDGGLTELGQAIRDGWTCELCHRWHPAREEHFSRQDCNETGVGVRLCEECVDVCDQAGAG